MSQIIDYKDCRLDHYNQPGRNGHTQTDPTGLCYLCIRDRSYDIQRQLGERFTGEVNYFDDEGQQRILTISNGFTNAGFNGIVAYGQRDDGQRVSPSAGTILI